MSPLAVLSVVAGKLNRNARYAGIPSLYFFTDPNRTPDPVRAAARLPRDAVVVYRHFGAADRLQTARRLAALCRRRGLWLLIGADAALARQVGADGVHWPERMVRRRSGFALETAAAHGPAGLRRARAAGMDACVLGPVFESRSPSAGPALGALRAGRLARGAGLPVIALGGVNAGNASKLISAGFSGLAAIDGFSVGNPPISSGSRFT